MGFRRIWWEGTEGLGGGITQPTGLGCNRRYSNKEIESCLEAKRELLQLVLGSGCGSLSVGYGEGES